MSIKIPVIRFTTPDEVYAEVERLNKLGKENRCFYLRDGDTDENGLKEVLVSIPEENAIEICMVAKNGDIKSILKF